MTKLEKRILDKKKYDAARYLANRAVYDERSVKYRKEHPEVRAAIVKRYDERHKNRRRIYNAKHVIYKFHNDPVYRVLHLCRNRLRYALRSQGVKKSTKTKSLFGCSTEYLKQYIESKFQNGMSWQNTRLWHIDHITPCAAFNLSDNEQLKMCFHFSNLQPLWSYDNLKKNSKIL